MPVPRHFRWYTLNHLVIYSLYIVVAEVAAGLVFMLSACPDR